MTRENLDIKKHPYSQGVMDIANILALKSRMGNADKDTMLPIPNYVQDATNITVRHIMETVHAQAKVKLNGNITDATAPIHSMAFAGLVGYYFTEIIEGEGIEISYSNLMAKISGVLYASLSANVFQKTMNSGAELYLQLYKARESRENIAEYHKQLEDIVRFYIISGEDKYLDQFAPLYQGLAKVLSN